MAVERELGLKLVYKLVGENEQVKCDVCGKSVPTGHPYALKSRPTTRGERIILLEEYECVTICSVVEGFKKTYQGDFDTPKPPMVYNPMWDNEPEIAAKGENRRIVTEREGIWVATGYIRQVRLGPSLFIECSAEQIQRKAFALDHQNRGGSFESWVTPDGMRVREYKQDDRDLRQGHWYFPASWVVIAPNLRMATIGELVGQRLKD